MADGEGLRRCEVLAILARAIDLAMGHPDELAMRAGLLSLAIAETLDLPRATCADAHLVALLRFVGCTAHADEVSQAFGDEIAFRAQITLLDPGNPREVGPLVVRKAGSHQPFPQRMVTAVRVTTGGKSLTELNFRTSCEAAQMFADRLGLGDGVKRRLWHVFERWDGRGVPNGVRGDDIELSARIALLAVDALVLQAAYGRNTALDSIKKRAGSAYDPTIVTAMVEHIDELWEHTYEGSAWDRVIGATPERDKTFTGQSVDEALLVLADFTDLKAPHLIGHSRAVSTLAATAVATAGSVDDVRITRRAALAHDLGRTAVPNSIWEKRTALTEAEFERVRLHPYQTERLLARTPSLARISAVAAAHHERCDGTGYFRGVASSSLPMPERVLAASDVYVAMTHSRPHRAALSFDGAAKEMRKAVDNNHLDRRAAEAVLGAAGHRATLRSSWPDGLTDREVDVVRLLARGLTNRQIARELVLSERTVAHHIEHILAKTGASTRGSAALYAVQHALLE
jgi:HD-GYP domain-containing protein (c-di-GMP phosphodiesterase class II)